jgi:hypothetical protein
MAHYKSANGLSLKCINESFSESEGESNWLDISFLDQYTFCTMCMTSMIFLCHIFVD